MSKSNRTQMDIFVFWRAPSKAIFGYSTRSLSSCKPIWPKSILTRTALLQDSKPWALGLLSHFGLLLRLTDSGTYHYVVVRISLNRQNREKGEEEIQRVCLPSMCRIDNAHHASKSLINDPNCCTYYIDAFAHTLYIGFAGSRESCWSSCLQNLEEYGYSK